MKAKSFVNIITNGSRFLSPEKIVDSLEIKEGDKIVDFGAGVGFWTFPLAKKVGSKGHVYALSSNLDFLGLLKRKAELLGSNNVTIEKFDLEKGKIEIKEKADIVLMVNVLHVIEDDAEALKRAKNLLKKGGRLVVIDYLKTKTLFGPPVRYRLSEEDVILMGEKVGLKFKCIFNAGFHHYGLIFTN